MTLEDVKEAVNEFFSDTTRSQEETREGLVDLKGDIHILIDAIDEDLNRRTK